MYKLLFLSTNIVRPLLDLSKEDFWYQTKVVLGVTLSKDELDAVFDYFDEDGGDDDNGGESIIDVEAN